MRKRLLPFLLVVPIALAACGGDDGNDAAAASSTTTAAPNGAGGGGDTLDVTASGFRFSPDALEAGTGETYTITLKNEDSASHTFTIDDVVDVPASAGESGTGEVTFDKPGDYTFHCRIHPTMTGTITVS